VVQVRRVAGAVAAVVALVAAGCSSDAGGGTGADRATPTTLVAHGGTEQIWLRTAPDVDLELVGPDGKVVPTDKVDAKGRIGKLNTRRTDAQGALVMRYLKPGKGYVVRRADGSAQSKPITVTGFDQHPPASFYDGPLLTTAEGKPLTQGYGYLTTRDGTKLAVNITLPGPPEDGPYPTVIEYSGYDPASPTPSLVTISKTLAAGQGFATVGVNVRGSGCSGGSFQLWEHAQADDGYDAVEAIAAQPWVLNHEVGMVGISYPATAMLYAAAQRPPHLAAIAPMATYDDGFRALLWPGGIQNKGFARHWIQERYDEAALDNPSEWVQTRLKEGDEVCRENLQMRGQNVDLASLIDVMPYFPEVKDLGNSFAPATFVDRIDVPVFLVAAWQDEQVGGHAPAMVDRFTGSPHLFATLTNGLHTEGLANPTVLQRWLEFLQLYVAHQAPDTRNLAGLYPAVAGQIIGDVDSAKTLPVPPERFAPGTSYEDALAQYEAQPTVRVLFDEGGSTEVPPGVPLHGFEHSFSTYPPSNVAATTWYLGSGGALTTAKPTVADDAAGSADAYTSDPSARPEIDLVQGEDSWWQLPKYDWAQPVGGKALSYVSPPLTEDTVMVGSGSADLWLRSSAQDTDLQVTLSEVRPDGKETLIQSGWLRASKRKLDDARSTALEPLITQRQQDQAPLPAGEFVPVRVEIYPFGHAFRKGSRIRLIITAPGGDKGVWSFVPLPGTQDDEIARSAGRPSAVVLPVVPDVDVPTALPACPSLRGQPCRDYQPLTNQPID
jgi:predicted acyl esterase